MVSKINYHLRTLIVSILILVAANSTSSHLHDLSNIFKRATVGTYLTKLQNTSASFFLNLFKSSCQKCNMLFSHTPLKNTELYTKLQIAQKNPALVLALIKRKFSTYPEKMLYRKLLYNGNIAPEKVAMVFNNMLRYLSGNKNAHRISMALSNQNLSLRATLDASDDHYFICRVNLLNDNRSIAKVRFNVIIENKSTPSEQLVIDDTNLEVDEAYRQQGIGRYLLSIMQTWIKTQAKSTLYVQPCPFNLRNGENQEDMLPILTTYYGKFGLIPDPNKTEDLFMSFENGKESDTMLFFRALYRNDYRTLLKMLKNGLNLNAMIDDEKISTLALQCAIANKNYRTFSFILSQIVIEDETLGHSLLEKCIENKQFQSAELILSRYPRFIDACDQNKNTLLHKIIIGDGSNADILSLKFLLKHQPNLDLKNRFQESATTLSAREGVEPYVRKLITEYLRQQCRKE